jgi:hypothetical protein
VTGIAKKAVAAAIAASALSRGRRLRAARRTGDSENANGGIPRPTGDN